MPSSPENLPRVVIVGAGFGGLACAQALGGKPVNVTIVDRRNYHLFVPLLYQVATAALSPADIARPIRRILGRYKNIEVVLGTVTGVDTAAKPRASVERHRASLRQARGRDRLGLLLFRPSGMGGIRARDRARWKTHAVSARTSSSPSSAPRRRAIRPSKTC